MTRNLMDQIPLALLTAAYTEHPNPQDDFARGERGEVVDHGLRTIAALTPRPELLAHLGRNKTSNYPAFEAAVTNTNAAPSTQKDMLDAAKRHALKPLEGATVFTIASAILGQVEGGRLTEQALDTLAKVGTDESTAVSLIKEGDITVRALFGRLKRVGPLAEAPELEPFRVGDWTLLEASLERRKQSDRFDTPASQGLRVNLKPGAKGTFEVQLSGTRVASDGRPIGQKMTCNPNTQHQDYGRRLFSLGALVDIAEVVIREDAVLNRKNAHDLLKRLNAPTQ